MEIISFLIAVFNGMGYDGDNISPHLAAGRRGNGRKGLSRDLLLRSTRRPSGWWHWVVVNLQRIRAY